MRARGHRRPAQAIGDRERRPAAPSGGAAGGLWLCRTRCRRGWCGGGAVGVEGDGPAPPVHQDQVVEGAQEQQIGEFVAPPWLRGMMWWTWQAAGGWSQPGAAQCRSRAMTARRRWAGMRSVTVPTSRGRLMEAAGRGRVPVRSQDARPPGPESRATALAQDEFAGRGPAQPCAGRVPQRRSRRWWSPGAPAGRSRLPGSYSAQGAGCAGEPGGEAVQQVVVDAAGDDGGEGGVAVVAGPGGRAGQHRARRRRRRGSPSRAPGLPVPRRKSRR